MTTKEIAHIRFQNQLLADNTRFESPKAIVAWMGAMQAQHFEMSKYAIGARLQDATKTLIETAMDKGEILRTHILRPTWHLVAQEDIRWMMELTGPNINKLTLSMNRQMQLDEALFKKSAKIIQKCLEGGKAMTRKEIMAELEKKGISTKSYSAAMFMFRAETDMLVCSGPMRKKETTYALFEERVPASPAISREEALAKLISRYLHSHGPATVKDFSWWSGLTLTDAKKALALVQKDFLSAVVDGESYWFSDNQGALMPNASTIQLLPAFDEFLVSYKSRDSTIKKEHQAKAFSGKNGYFQPIIVQNAQVIGTWKPSGTGKNASLSYDFFEKGTKAQEKEMEKAVAHYREFAL